MDTDVIIIGGGAAGLMCARTAASRGRRAVVIDHGRKPGRKVLLAGGGKCNFTNRTCSAANFISHNPHFVKSALAQYTEADLLAEVEAASIAYEQRDHGRLFCRHAASPLLNMLIEPCRQNGVTFLMGRNVESVDKKNRFIVDTGPETLSAESLVVATGGLSWPQAGASGLGHELARQFGLSVTATRPGLVGLVYAKKVRSALGGLTGNALNATVACGKQRFTENVLFTHTGLSGPAILQISNYWRPGQTITIDWLPDVDVYAMLVEQKQQPGKATFQRVLSRCLPNRMVRQWQRYLPDKPLAECSLDHLRQAADSINRWLFEPAGTEGYEKAEVTIGGVDTDGLDSKTLQTRNVPGLYFIGEVVDVAGQLGGYNLQWAFSSGTTAGCVC